MTNSPPPLATATNNLNVTSRICIVKQNSTSSATSASPTDTTLLSTTSSSYFKKARKSPNDSDLSDVESFSLSPRSLSQSPPPSSASFSLVQTASSSTSSSPTSFSRSPTSTEPSFKDEDDDTGSFSSTSSFGLSPASSSWARAESKSNTPSKTHAVRSTRFAHARYPNARRPARAREDDEMDVDDHDGTFDDKLYHSDGEEEEVEDDEGGEDDDVEKEDARGLWSRSHRNYSAAKSTFRSGSTPTSRDPLASAVSQAHSNRASRPSASFWPQIEVSARGKPRDARSVSPPWTDSRRSPHTSHRDLSGTAKQHVPRAAHPHAPEPHRSRPGSRETRGARRSRSSSTDERAHEERDRSPMRSPRDDSPHYRSHRKRGRPPRTHGTPEAVEPALAKPVRTDGQQSVHTPSAPAAAEAVSALLRASPAAAAAAAAGPTAVAAKVATHPAPARASTTSAVPAPPVLPLPGSLSAMSVKSAVSSTLSTATSHASTHSASSSSLSASSVPSMSKPTVVVPAASAGTNHAVQKPPPAPSAAYVGAVAKVDAKKDTSGRTRLFKVAQRGQVEMVRELLDKGANVNHQDNAGWTPLHEAVLAKNEAVVALLLSRGACPNAQGLYGSTPLHDVDTVDYEPVARLLLKYGASVTLANDEGLAPLENDDVCPEIRDLYHHYFHIEEALPKRDAFGMTFLQRCCYENNVALATELIRFRRVDVNVADNIGWTPLHEAIRHVAVDLVTCLLQHGAAVDTVSTQQKITPLHDAAERNALAIVRVLLAYGADRTRRNAQGQTALDLATDADVRDALLHYFPDPILRRDVLPPPAPASLLPAAAAGTAAAPAQSGSVSSLSGPPSSASLPSASSLSSVLGSPVLALAPGSGLTASVPTAAAAAANTATGGAASMMTAAPHTQSASALALTQSDALRDEESKKQEKKLSRDERLMKSYIARIEREESKNSRKRRQASVAPNYTFAPVAPPSQASSSSSYAAPSTAPNSGSASVPSTAPASQGAQPRAPLPPPTLQSSTANMDASTASFSSLATSSSVALPTTSTSVSAVPSSKAATPAVSQVSAPSTSQSVSGAPPPSLLALAAKGDWGPVQSQLAMTQAPMSAETQAVFVQAIRQGRVDVLQTFLRLHRVDLDATHALYHAVRFRQVRAVRLFLSHGADPHRPGPHARSAFDLAQEHALAYFCPPHIAVFPLASHFYVRDCDIAGWCPRFPHFLPSPLPHHPGRVARLGDLVAFLTTHPQPLATRFSLLNLPIAPLHILPAMKKKGIVLPPKVRYKLNKHLPPKTH